MRWRTTNEVAVPDDLQKFVGGHPIVARRLARAGMTDPSAARAFLDPDAYRPTSPFELPDLEVAVERLRRAIRRKEPILVWGDFDVDGQTATALLFTALGGLGANVQYHVPLRDGEGHGMHPPKLREWLSRGVKLIVTCDTGITSHEAVREAQSSGVGVIITDHHLLGDTLPEALAVINPMRLPPEHSLRELPGVAVAWELIDALAEGRGCDGLLDLVALGIVADVAEQVKETRYLLQRGLAMMRVSKRPGLLALFECAEIDQLELTETDIGFGLAPRLNAQGRLSNAADSVELLSTGDEARAAELASQLEGMNARRKLESRLIEESAHTLIERDPSLLEYPAIVLSHPEWTSGVAGIVANRLADAYQKPVVLLCEQGERAFGSARSVSGCNITDALRDCRSKLLKFGGHAMAAGLTLRRDDIFEFRRMLSRAVREMMPAAVEEPELEIDGFIRLGEISNDLVEDLRRLAPFGNGNPPLTLASTGLRLIRKKKLGRGGDHLEMVVEDENGAQQKVFWWNAGDQQIPAARFDLAYSLRISRYKGRRELQLELIDLLPIEGGDVEIAPEAAEYAVEDYRDETDPHGKLQELLDLHADAVVWREADRNFAGFNRTELKNAETLIVWTAPPGPEEWDAALKTVMPRKVVVFGRLPDELTVESFLQRLGGLIKHVINARGGEATLDQLAAATAQRADAVRYGLRWFEQAGQIDLDLRRDGGVRIARSQAGKIGSEQAAIEKLLKSVLAETAIFRKNWIVSA